MVKLLVKIAFVSIHVVNWQTFIIFVSGNQSTKSNPKIYQTTQMHNMTLSGW